MSERAFSQNRIDASVIVGVLGGVKSSQEGWLFHECL